MKKLIQHFFSLRSTQSNEYGKTCASKYVKSGLTLQEALEIKEKIRQAFEHDKLYKNNTVGLNELSCHISRDRYKVSQVLNVIYSHLPIIGATIRKRLLTTLITQILIREAHFIRHLPPKYIC